MSEHPFVFIIGFNKTATTSLHALFAGNGFPAVHWDNGRLAMAMLSNVCSNRPVMTGYDDRYRVFSDMTFRTPRFRFEGNSLFRVMDADYPSAFFIYNTRDLQGWLESRAAHTARMGGETILEFEMRLLQTNEPQLVFDKWTREREAFEAEMRLHFAGRGGLLEIDVADPALPEKVGAFVGWPLDMAHWQRHNPRR